MDLYGFTGPLLFYERRPFFLYHQELGPGAKHTTGNESDEWGDPERNDCFRRFAPGRTDTMLERSKAHGTDSTVTLSAALVETSGCQWQHGEQRSWPIWVEFAYTIHPSIPDLSLSHTVPLPILPGEQCKDDSRSCIEFTIEAVGVAGLSLSHSALYRSSCIWREGFRMNNNR